MKAVLLLSLPFAAAQRGELDALEDTVRATMGLVLARLKSETDLLDFSTETISPPSGTSTGFFCGDNFDPWQVDAPPPLSVSLDGSNLVCHREFNALSVQDPQECYSLCRLMHPNTVSAVFREALPVSDIPWERQDGPCCCQVGEW